MNRNRYRLIFDKRTGTLIPVAEFTTSAKKGNGGGLGEGVGDGTVPRWRRLCAMVALGLGLPLTLHAQNVPDPSNGVTVSDTANGVPLINIVDPNASGLSHNRFLDFNVGTEGMVFNNSLADGVSAIGGFTMKNPQLTREANGILVEVTGGNPSKLLGTKEVFGGEADLLIANRNGLYVNGASAVNVGRLTYTTGTPTGSGRTFEIHGGQIDIDGDGVSLQDVSHFDMVARLIRLNAAMAGSSTVEARLVAGLNTFDATTGEVRKREDGGAATLGVDAHGTTPAYAIDGTAVGAMHGGHVMLVSTESGLGVRHEGSLTAAQDIQISVDGDLRLRGFQARDVALSAEDISLGGADRDEDRSTNVDGTLQVAARGDLLLAGNHEAATMAFDVDGTLVSNGQVRAVHRTAGATAAIDVEAGALALTGGATWQAGDRITAEAGSMQLADGARMLAKDVSLTAGTLDNAGRVTANNTLEVGADLLVNRGTMGGGRTRVDAARLSNSGLLQAGTDLDITLGDGESRNSGGLAAGGDLTLRGLRARLVNEGELLAGDQLLLEIETLDQRAGATLWGDEILLRLARLENAGTVSGRTLDITASWLRNAGADAWLYAEEDARLDIANDLENTDGATVYAVRDLSIDADGNVRNAAGASITSGTPDQSGTLALRAGGDLVNTGDAAIHGDAVDLAIEGTLHNEADILGFDSLTVDAGAVDNAGQLRGYDVSVTTTGALTNRDGGRLTATDTLDATVGGTLTNRGAGSVIGADTVTATTGDVDNRDGALLQGTTALTLDAGHVANQARIAAGDTLALDAASIDNTGTIAAHDIDATTQGDLVNRAGGRIQAGNRLQATVGGNLSNRGANTALVGGSVELEVDGTAENADGALLQATRALSLRAEALANRNAKLLAGTIDPNSGAVVVGDMALETTDGDLVNDGGQIVATGTAWIDAAGNLHNGANAQIAAGNAFLTATGNLTNAASAAIDAVGRADLRVDQVLDNDGRIAGQRVWIEADAALDNSGQVVGGDWIEADTKALRNAASGSIEAKNDVDLSTETFANTGRIHSANRTTLTIENGLDLAINDSAQGPTADGVLTLNADDVRIDRELANAGSIVINATGNIENNDGILTGKTFAASARGAFTNDSLLWAADDIDIEAASLRNTAGSDIEATRNLWISVDGELVNEAGARIAAGGDGAIDAQVLRNEVSHDGTGVRKVGDARGESSHNDGHNTYKLWIGTQRLYGGVGQGYYWANHGAGLAILGSDLTVTDQGMIETGGTLRINQGAKHGQDAQVINQGHILAGANLLIDGDVDNVGVTASESIEDYLRRPTYLRISADDNDGFVGKSAEFDNLYDLLSDVFDETWRRGLGMAGKYWHSYEVANAIKAMNNAQLNKVMSHVFGADWRAVEYDVMVTRWNAFKADIANRSGMEALADRGPEIMAGGTIDHTGGHFRNIGGGQQRENQELTVNIGDEEVTTIGGSFDVLTNLRDLTQALDPRAALDKLTADGNKKFQQAPARPDVQPIDWAQLPPPTGPIGIPTPPVPVYPLFETRIAFIDQSTFYGSDYFFRQIGFQSDRTVTVVGDNYFINELVNQQVTSQVGGFFAARDGVVGAELVRQLMDAAGAEGPRLGLRVGVAPTAAQLAQLDRDIVWFVETEVNGQPALVPQVFLSAQTVADVQADRAAGGATVAARQHVFIDADEGGVANHNGTIRAGGSLDIVSAGRVDNSSDNGLAGGGLRAGQTVFIEAQGDVTNLGGTIEGRDVYIETEGSFTDAVRMGYNDQGDLVVRQQSQIRGGGADPVVPAVPADKLVDGVLQSALSAPSDGLAGSRAVTMADGGTATAPPTPPAPPAGSVTIKAKGDVTLTGSDIRARDVRVESEEGNLVARDVHEVKSSFEHERTSGFLTSMSTTTTTAEATSVGSTLRGAADGGSLVLKAGGDITLQGGEYGADSGLIQAGGDVITKTGRDYTHKETVTVAEGLSLGARAGAAGAGVAAEYGPMGASAAAVGYGQENPEAAGGKPLASGKAVLGESLGAHVGWEKIEITETQSTIKNHNAQLDFGSDVTILADGAVDIGGADIRAKKGEGDDTVLGDVTIRAAEVKSTKFEDVDHRTSERKETFVGFTGSGSSSALDAVNNSKALADKVAQGMSVNAGMTTAQAAGDATNLVFNDLGALSVNAGVKHSVEKSTQTDRSENINTVQGNIVIQSTSGDIDLKGVVLDGNGAGVVLNSARDIKLASAERHTEGSSSRESHQVQIGVSASVAPTGAGVGASIGYNGDRSDTSFSGTSHINSTIIGSNVTLVSQGDTTLQGANVIAGTVDLDVKGDMRIESVQDTYTEDTTRANWGTSVGGAVTTQSIVAVTASAEAGGGKSWDHSAVTAQQSGIQAGSINGTVGGDLTLKGAHIVATDRAPVGETGQEAGLHVGGAITSEALKDTHEKGGLTVGAGAGISKTGLASININIETDDAIHYEANQLNTISGLNVTSGQGTTGPINTDADNMVDVVRDEKIAGNRVSATVGVQDIAEGISSLRGGDGDAATAPTVADVRPNRRASTSGDADVADGPAAPTVVENTTAARPRATEDAVAPSRAQQSGDEGVVLRRPEPEPEPDYDQTPPPDYDMNMRYERGTRLSPGVGKIVEVDHVKDLGNGLLVRVDDNGNPTKRYVEPITVGGVEKFVEAGTLNMVEGRPATLADVADLTQTFEVERPKTMAGLASGDLPGDAFVLPKRDYNNDDSLPIEPVRPLSIVEPGDAPSRQSVSPDDVAVTAGQSRGEDVGGSLSATASDASAPSADTRPRQRDDAASVAGAEARPDAVTPTEPVYATVDTTAKVSAPDDVAGLASALDPRDAEANQGPSLPPRNYGTDAPSAAPVQKDANRPQMENQGRQRDGADTDDLAMGRDENGGGTMPPDATRDRSSVDENGYETIPADAARAQPSVEENGDGTIPQDATRARSLVDENGYETVPADASRSQPSVRDENGYDTIPADLPSAQASVGKKDGDTISAHEAGRSLVDEDGYARIPGDEPGKQGYFVEPRVGDDSALAMAKLAATRLMDGKEPLPVIFHNAKDMAKFKADLAKFRKSIAKDLKSKSLNAQKREKLTAAHEATKPGRITLIDNAREGLLAKLDPATSKLYLDGHGFPGGDGILYTRGDKLLSHSSEQMARQLADAGLDPAFSDIRLFACSSACPAKDGGPSNAERVADALGRAGFQNVEVSGYPGIIEFFGDRLDDGKYHRTVIQPDGTPTQASTVREKFRYDANSARPQPAPGQQNAPPPLPPRPQPGTGGAPSPSAPQSKSFKDAARTDNPTFSRFKESSLKPVADALAKGGDFSRVLEAAASVPAEKWNKYPNAKQALLASAPDAYKARVEGLGMPSRPADIDDATVGRHENPYDTIPEDGAFGRHENPYDTIPADEAPGHGNPYDTIPEDGAFGRHENPYDTIPADEVPGHDNPYETIPEDGASNVSVRDRDGDDARTSLDESEYEPLPAQMEPPRSTDDEGGYDGARSDRQQPVRPSADESKYEPLPQRSADDATRGPDYGNLPADATPSPDYENMTVDGVATRFKADVGNDARLTMDEPGKQGYFVEPKVGDDNARAMTKIAATRILDGKEPLPVIFLNAEDMAKFQADMAVFRGLVADELQFPDLDPEGRMRLEAAYEASAPGRITLINDADAKLLATLDPGTSKLYLDGHGRPGDDGIGYQLGDRWYDFSSEEMVQQLKDAGLKSEFEDIRLFSCSGACPADDGGPSSAERITGALGRAGFSNVEVSAYPGSIRFFGDRLDDGGFHRVVVMPDGAEVQASKVRQKFRYDPDSDRQQPTRSFADEDPYDDVRGATREDENPYSEGGSWPAGTADEENPYSEARSTLPGDEVSED